MLYNLNIYCSFISSFSKKDITFSSHSPSLNKAIQDSTIAFVHLALQRKHIFLISISWIIMPCHPRGMPFSGCKSCCCHTNSLRDPAPPAADHHLVLVRDTRQIRGLANKLTHHLSGRGMGSSKKPATKPHRRHEGGWKIKSRVKVIVRRWTPGKQRAHSSTIYTTHSQNQTRVHHGHMENMQVYNKK